MTDKCLWRMFCETGEPFCYLLYKSELRQMKQKLDFPPKDTLAFSDKGETPRIRF